MLLKLPVCPYCKAIYRYDDVRKKTHDSTIKCHNCNRNFKVSYVKGRVILLLAAAVLLIAINVLMFNFINGVTLLGCLIFTAVFISLAVLLFPYTVRYKKIDGEEENTEQNTEQNDSTKKKKRSQKNKDRKNKN